MKLEKVLEIVRIKQIVRESEYGRYSIKSPEDVAHVIQKEIGDEDREVFFVVCLNPKMEIVAIHRASMGNLNSSIVHPREVFKSAILNNASSIIVGHNHPSYNLSPSPEDIEVTKRLAKASEIIGIELLDHILVSETQFISFKEKGYM